jgi:hypothetical protein
MASHNNHFSCDPPRENRCLEEKHFSQLIPFGTSTATNVLQYFLGTPDIETNVRKLLLSQSKVYY